MGGSSCVFSPIRRSRSLPGIKSPRCSPFLSCAISPDPRTNWRALGKILMQLICNLKYGIGNRALALWIPYYPGDTPHEPADRRGIDPEEVRPLRGRRPEAVRGRGRRPPREPPRVDPIRGRPADQARMDG